MFQMQASVEGGLTGETAFAAVAVRDRAAPACETRPELAGIDLGDVMNGMGMPRSARAFLASPNAPAFQAQGTGNRGLMQAATALASRLVSQTCMHGTSSLQPVVDTDRALSLDRAGISFYRPAKAVF